MPTYVFTTKSGRSIELQYAMGEAPTNVEIDGEIAKRDIAAEHAGPRWSCDSWPLYSDAAGVHPSQVQEAQKSAADRGVPTDFTSDGRAVFRSRGHRREYLRAIGMFDRDAGYSD